MSLILLDVIAALLSTVLSLWLSRLGLLVSCSCGCFVMSFGLVVLSCLVSCVVLVLRLVVWCVLWRWCVVFCSVLFCPVLFCPRLASQRPSFHRCAFGALLYLSRALSAPQ